MSPKPAPATKPDRHYDFRGMNLIFALSSLALLAVTLWMVFADYAKPWKRLQAEFRSRERQMLQAEAEAERQKIKEEDLATVRQDIADQTARLAEQRDELDQLEDSLQDAKDKVYEYDAAWRTTKSLLDTARYEYGEALQGDDEESIAEHAAEVQELKDRFGEDQIRLEAAREQRREIEAKLDERRSAFTAAEKRLAALNEGLSNLEQRVAVLDKDLDYFVLNAPLMDFLEPSLKIEQVILSGLYQDINFAEAQRVDRCMTCHPATNRPGFEGEGWEHPFSSHPNLDLFVGDGSPHPYNRFGCTVCHAGLDRGTDFARVGHTPTTEEQRREWIAEWDWEPQKYLENPILPNGTAEAGCVNCHATEVWTPGTETLDVGRQLVSKMGCYGCHVIDYPAFTDLREAGPDLRNIASKTTPEWAFEWIAAPRDFRPTSWMPHFFYESNTQTPENQERQKIEIAASVAYLWDRSDEPVAYAEPPAGDVERGRALFESVGCTGCHILDREATRDDFFPDIRRLHGPNLVRTGSKVSAGWLFAWLKDPQAYYPETNMPDLRLTDREAADLVAYLMAERDPAFEGTAIPAIDGELRDELALGYLRNNYTVERSEAVLAEMDEHARNVYLGEKTITKYGCYGCHAIAGFEDAKPIGIELSEEGSKPLHQFDFGHVHDIEHTRHDWIFNKLKRPRVYDKGKEIVKDYQELYKMPNFGMSDREAHAVMVNVLGFTESSARAERRAGLDARTPALAAGRKLVTRYNCQGCHLIEGEGQSIRQVLDRNLLPPNLASQGARVQSDWLFNFLHNPDEVSLRPWLSVRMPTFGFTDDEVNTLTGYFAALDEREPFLSPKGAATERDRAVGRVVYGMLQCARCHPSGPEASLTGGASAAELAPSLLLAQERLRWDWVPDWIKDPQRWVPGTNMPTNFPAVGDGGYSSPLVHVFDTPMFAPNQRELMRYFSSELELKEYLSDVDRVSAALRDHIWTLR